MSELSLLERLDEEDLNLIIMSKRGLLYSSRDRGINPLIDAIDSLGIRKLQDSTVVDRIIGKASALLICHFNAKNALAKLMSAKGADVLKEKGIGYYAEASTRDIKDKTKTDICPFEKIVLQVNSPSEAYKLLKEAGSNRLK
ncbi:MAG: DUF1893 domain-containing protein [Candidatus Atabeyarchaeum deiterrae]